MLTNKKSFETTIGYKQQCREDIVTYAKHCNIGGPYVRANVLTLPSREHICYDLFKATWPKARIICLESERDIADQLNDEGIHTIHAKTTDYLRSVDKYGGNFNIVFLDYYSFITQSVLDDVGLLVRGNDNNPFLLQDPAKGPSVVAVTLQKAVRQGIDKTRSKLLSGLIKQEDCFREIENGCDINMVKSLLIRSMSSSDEVNRIVVPLIAREYKAEEGSTPMFFFLFKIC